ncbi:MAG TPA: hypothetical protein VNG33_06665 [Polyangiaceae bacterium]|nr:hypothetical protein [Polyangiaceae bacterium]
MNRSRHFSVSALIIGLTWMVTGACSSSGADNAPSSNGGVSVGTSGTASGGQTVVDTGGSSNGGGIADNINPLCGVSIGAGTCVPDQETACRDYVPMVGGAGGAGGANPIEEAGGMAGVAGISGGGAPQGGAPQGGAQQAGAPNMAGAGGAGHAGAGTAGEGGVAGESGAGNSPAGSPHYSCQVARQNNQAIRQCVLAGTGTANAPCFSAADCAPTFACVSDGDAGRCLRYCCKPDTDCHGGTYCAERPLLKAALDASNAEPPHVPVCVPADNCSLEEPFPCPKGDCRCTGDTACMVVRDDGTTTCITPGTGQAGEACPCAWNHVCSSVTHQCVKICNTDPTKSDCGQQKCQASSELPPNFGVCVGPLK